MSHISVVQTKIIDRDLLVAALEKLGYTVTEGEDLRVQSAERTVKVDLLIAVPYSDPIGFHKGKNGYRIVADWFRIQLDQKQFTQSLLQQYAYLSVMKTLGEQGFHLIEEQSDERNRIHLLLRRTGE